MKQPIEFVLPQSIKDEIWATRLRPKFSTLSLVHSEKEIIPLPSANIFCQHCADMLYFLQVLEAHPEKSIEINFKILDPTVFLLYFMKGDLSYYDYPTQKMLAKGKEGTFQLCYFHPGTYTTKLTCHPYRLLAIAIDIDWLTIKLDSFAAFRPIINLAHLGSDGILALPLAHMGKRVQQLTERILAFTEMHEAVRATGIFHLITKSLSIYNQSLRTGHGLFPQFHEPYGELLDDYVSENLATDKVNDIIAIADNLGISAWKVREVSLKQFGKPLQQYIISQRMKKGMHLLKQSRLKIKQVAKVVGFADHGYFCKVFKKYFRISPGSVRSKT